MAFGYDDKQEQYGEEFKAPENAPLEPGKNGKRLFSTSKLFFFFIIVAYLIFSFFKAPILTYLGQYLVVQDQPQKTDLIVCLAGGNVERGLAAIDAYQAGWAPLVFFLREEPPDGYQALAEKGLHYPQEWDLLKGLFKEAGVPDAAVMAEETVVKSTIDEARLVGELVKQKGYRSVTIITSPTHSRRAMLTFKTVLKDQKVQIIVRSSAYSRFSPATWWKERRYQREVILEYQKLIYYTFKYFL